VTDKKSRPPPDPSLTINLARVKRPKLATARAVAREQIAPYAGALRIAGAQLAKSRVARIGAFVLAFLALTAVFADFLASDLPIVCGLHGSVYVAPNLFRPTPLAGYDCARISAEGGWQLSPLVHFGPRQTESGGKSDPLRAPFASSGHPLGTDALGRDLFARVVHGTRTALTFAFGAALAFVGVGVGLGALAGFFGGPLDSFISRVVETLTSFPTLVLVLVVQAITPHPSLTTLLVALALTRWTEVARLVRAEVLLVGAQDYVTAARALGAAPWRVLRRHVLPNAVAPALVAATFGIATVVLIEAALDFLHVGVPDAVASWGETLGEAREHTAAWWLLVFPGAMVFATVAALNLVGEALRDALDPRLRDGVEVRAP
jgi:peptide/nickel transport system permease protein